MERLKIMKTAIVKLFAWICAGLSLFAMTGCDSTRGSEPMFKIRTSTPIIQYLKGKENYYIVYENGAVKKTDKFDPAKVESYGYSSINDDPYELYGIDVTAPEGENLNKIIRLCAFSFCRRRLA